MAHIDCTNEDLLVLQDILRQGCLVADLGNFPEGEQQRITLFNTTKSHGIDIELPTKNIILATTKVIPESSRREYYNSAITAAEINRDKLIRYIKKENEVLKNRFIATEIRALAATLSPNTRPLVFMLVFDTKSGIADVIVNSPNIEAGGYVTSPLIGRRRFWTSPDEVMFEADRKRIKAKVRMAESPGFNKIKISENLRNAGITYTRYYNCTGVFSYTPSDHYFRNKAVAMVSMIGETVRIIAKYDIRNAVLMADKMRFKRVNLLDSDSGDPILMIQPFTQDPIGVYITTSIAKSFIHQLQNSDKQQALEIRQGMAEKYYNIILSSPELKVDIFGQVPEDIEISDIRSVALYRRQTGDIMISPIIIGLSRTEPRPLTRGQIQRLRICDDIDFYKKTLAANIYATEIRTRGIVSPSEESQSPAPKSVRLSKQETAEYRMIATYRKPGEFDLGLSFHKYERRYLACFTDSKKIEKEDQEFNYIDLSTSNGDISCVILDEHEVREKIPFLIERFGCVTILERDKVRLYGEKNAIDTADGLSIKCSKPQIQDDLSLLEKDWLYEKSKKRGKDYYLDGLLFMRKEGEKLYVTGIDTIPVFKHLGITPQFISDSKGGYDACIYLDISKQDEYISILAERCGTAVLMEDNSVAKIYGEKPEKRQLSIYEADDNIEDLIISITPILSKYNITIDGKIDYRLNPAIRANFPEWDIQLIIGPDITTNEPRFFGVLTKDGVTISDKIYFENTIESTTDFLKQIGELYVSAIKDQEYTKSANDNIYYTEIAVSEADWKKNKIKIDELMEERDYASILALVSDLDPGLEPDLSTFTSEAASEKSVVIAEDENYAVVFHSENGEYTIRRKIRDSQLRDFLCSNPHDLNNISEELKIYIQNNKDNLDLDSAAAIDISISESLLEFIAQQQDKNPDSLTLYQVEDCYYVFGQDAELISKHTQKIAKKVKTGEEDTQYIAFPLREKNTLLKPIYEIGKEIKECSITLGKGISRNK